MFSRNNSRSSSTHSIPDPPPSDNGRDEQEMDYEEIIDGIPTSNESDKSFTKLHPMGQCLLRIAAQNIELCKKIGIKAQNSDLDDLCRSFTKAIRLERQHNSKNALDPAAIEDSILSKELSFHHLNSPVSVPDTFSESDTLNNATALQNANKLFPMRGNARFSGHPSQGVTIIEFLNTMNSAQKICNLSLPEFKSCLLRSTTGKPYTLINNYLASNFELADIYSSLLIIFNNELTPQEAKRLLVMYRAPRGMNFTKLQAQILHLAGRVASSLPSGESRASLFNIEACSALMAALPPTSSQIVQNIYNNLACRLESYPSFCQLAKALFRYTDTINDDLRANGQVSRNPRNDGFDRFDQNRPRFGTYAVNRNGRFRNAENNQRKPQRSLSVPLTTMSATAQYQSNQTNRKTTPSRPIGNNTWNKNPNRNNNTQSAPNGNYRNRNDQNQRQKSYGKGNRFQNRSSCSLCGLRNHRAADCRRMIDPATGKQITVVPSYTPCKICETSTGRKLFHPEQYCLSKNKTQ